MRSLAHAATMSRMNQPSKTVELVLRLTTDAQTVSGSLQGKDGRRLSFWGWLDLMDALQRLVARHVTAASATCSALAGRSSAGTSYPIVTCTGRAALFAYPRSLRDGRRGCGSPCAVVA